MKIAYFLILFLLFLNFGCTRYELKTPRMETPRQADDDSISPPSYEEDLIKRGKR